MSLYLTFEPHSWYRGFAIMDTATAYRPAVNGGYESVRLDARRRHAYTDNGNTYRIVELKADTLHELKQRIAEYRGIR